MDPSKLKLEMIDQAKRTLLDLGLRYGPRFISALVILVLGILIVRRIVRVMDDWLTKREMEPPLRMLLVRLLTVLLMALVLMLMLQNLGLELLPLFAGLGVAGIGAGLATKGVFSNLVAGLVIIFTRPFRVGEYIAIAGVEGQVKQVSLFSTQLSHTDRSLVVIPNRRIVGEILHNYGSSRQLDLSIGVAYGTDLAEAFARIAAVLGRNERVLQEPAPVVGINTLADSSIAISVKPWVKVVDFVPAGGEIYRELIREFRVANIEIPFPQREVKLLSPVPSALLPASR